MNLKIYRLEKDYRFPVIFPIGLLKLIAISFLSVLQNAQDLPNLWSLPIPFSAIFLSRPLHRYGTYFFFSFCIIVSKCLAKVEKVRGL